jgi:prepilin-type N-terminal cleavage/methylation domain-containing protein
MISSILRTDPCMTSRMRLTATSFDGKPHLMVSDQKAFTLMELLVTIAVIALLAAMSLASLGRANELARLTVCKNNLRQIALALGSYVSETTEYPLYYQWLPATTSHLGLSQQLDPENHDALARSVFSCPGFTRIPGHYDLHGSVAFGYNISGAPRIPNTRLGLGGDLIDEFTSHSYFRPRKESEVIFPSDMIAIADALIFKPEGFGNSPPFVYDLNGIFQSDNVGFPAEKYYQRRHSGPKWNVAFCDSHIETLRTVKVFDLTNAPIRARWNVDLKPHFEIPN